MDSAAIKNQKRACVSSSDQSEFLETQVHLGRSVLTFFLHFQGVVPLTTVQS